MKRIIMLFIVMALNSILHAQRNNSTSLSLRQWGVQNNMRNVLDCLRQKGKCVQLSAVTDQELLPLYTQRNFDLFEAIEEDHGSVKSDTTFNIVALFDKLQCWSKEQELHLVLPALSMSALCIYLMTINTV